MKPARHITLWLAAVIVMVAVAVMPSDARAHEGHAHHGGLVDAVSAVAAMPAQDASKALEAASATGLVVQLPAILSETSLSAGPHAACTCVGCPSCVHAPSSCCATGLAPSAAPWPTRPTVSGRALVRDGPRLSGIVPEAQAEPPRPFA